MTNSAKTDSKASTDDSQRLNKFLAFHLGLSRREADKLIDKKSVSVNDTVATLGSRVHTEDEVKVAGRIVSRKSQYTYMMLNKPKNYVCSRRQQGETPTIYSLLPDKLHSLKSVGRLDGNSSGLLLMSDDGDFTYKMTHPKFYKSKVYLVQLDTPLQPLHQQMISDIGVHLEDGPSKFTVSKLEQNVDHPDLNNSQVYEVIMHEGRNRQIRRTFAALGYTVTTLHRTQFGVHSLEDLAPGEYKFLTI